MPLSGILTDYLGWQACFYFYGRFYVKEKKLKLESKHSNRSLQ